MGQRADFTKSDGCIMVCGKVGMQQNNYQLKQQSSGRPKWYWTYWRKILNK